MHQDDFSVGDVKLNSGSGTTEPRDFNKIVPPSGTASK
jgi:hypothetical protein